MLSASQQEVTGTLKLAVPIETGQLVVGRLVAKFLQAYPALQVELELTNRVVDPISEGLDAVVRIGDMSDSNLAARRLWSTGRLLCASPDYLARSPVIERPEDLANHERVTVSSGFLASHWCFELDGREVLVDPHPVFGSIILPVPGRRRRRGWGWPRYPLCSVRMSWPAASW